MKEQEKKLEDLPIELLTIILLYAGDPQYLGRLMQVNKALNTLLQPLVNEKYFLAQVYWNNCLQRDFPNRGKKEPLLSSAFSLDLYKKRSYERKENSKLTDDQRKLFNWIRSGDLDSIKNAQDKGRWNLLELLAITCDETQDGHTAFSLASLYRQKKMLAYFYQISCETSARSAAHAKEGENIYLAAACGMAAEIVRLISRTDNDITSIKDKGTRALAIAVEYDHLECVKALINASININVACSNNSLTPLYIAAKHGRLDCMNLLIKANANVNLGSTSNGTTPLCIAAGNGHLHCMDALITAGANINLARTRDGATPLYIAAKNGQADCLNELIKKGANIYLARTSDGATPLYIAARNGHVDCMNLLITAGGGNINQGRRNDGATPLHIATGNHHVNCMNELITAGGNINLPRTSDGATPLYIAAWSGNVNCMDLLIKAGSNINLPRTSDGATPLYIATKNGHAECVNTLITAGANIKIAPSDGKTPFKVAKHQRHQKIYALLKFKQVMEEQQGKPISQQIIAILTCPTNINQRSLFSIFNHLKKSLPKKMIIAIKKCESMVGDAKISYLQTMLAAQDKKFVSEEKLEFINQMLLAKLSHESTLQKNPALK